MMSEGCIYVSKVHNFELQSRQLLVCSTTQRFLAWPYSICFLRLVLYLSPPICCVSPLEAGWPRVMAPGARAGAPMLDSTSAPNRGGLPAPSKGPGS